MAFSSSVKRSQDIIHCQLCETAKQIKVKCIDCDLLMCDDCKNKFHIKFRDADIHTVVLLSDIGLHTENESRGFKLVKCRVHTNQFYCMYCSKCKILVCPKCLSSDHRKHDITDIDNICLKQVKQLEDSQKKTNEDFETYIQKLKNLRHIEESRYSKIKQDILDEEVKAKKAIEERYASQLESLQKERQQTDKLILDRIETVTKEKAIIDEKRREVKNFGKLDPLKILDCSSDVLKASEQFSRMTQLDCYKINTFYYDKGMFLFDSSSHISRFESELKVIASYKTPSYVQTLTVDVTGSLWTSDRKKIMLLDPSTNLAPVKGPIIPGVEVNEMKCTKNNTVWITSCSKLIRLLPDGNIHSYKDFYPHLPLTLHITRQNDIIVGMDHRAYENSEDKPVLIRLSSDAIKKREYSNLNKTLLLNKVVRSCATFKDETICYIDSEWTQGCPNERLVKLNVDGSIAWTYSGKTARSITNKQFYPIEVLCTEVDNCLISDSCDGNYGLFHILSTTGHLISVIDLTLLGITEPEVMAEVDANHLWVTQFNRTIHSIKYSGF